MVNGKKCVCYINELLKYDEPGEILRAVWYCCNTLHNIMTSEEGVGGEKEITRLRENELKIKEIVQKMVKNNRERETIMGQLKANFDKNDEYIREILNGETNKICSDYYSIVVQWWRIHMKECENSEQINSASLWTHFKKDNQQMVGVMDSNLFKDILVSFVDEKHLLKPKIKNGALKIMNYVYDQ